MGLKTRVRAKTEYKIEINPKIKAKFRALAKPILLMSLSDLLKFANLDYINLK